MITYEQAKEAAAGYKVVPISKEILSDIKTPIEVLRILKQVSSHCYILESVENQEKWGRYTFLGFEPTMEITCVDGRMKIRNGTEIQMKTFHPREMIQKILEEYTSPGCRTYPPLPAGWWDSFPMITSSMQNPP